MLTLAEAKRTGRLAEFIAQEEAHGVGPANRKAFDAAVTKVVKPPKSKGRTSRSALRAYSTGR